MKCNMTFLSFDTFFQQVTPLAPAMASHHADEILNGTITFLRSDYSNEVQQDLFVK